MSIIVDMFPAGDHFTSLTSQQVSPPQSKSQSGGIQVHSPDGAADIKPVDSYEERVAEILSNSEMREILLDSKVQQLMKALRSDADEAQR